MKQIKFFLAAIMCILVSNVAMADDTPIPVEPRELYTLKRTGTHTSAVSTMEQR